MRTIQQKGKRPLTAGRLAVFSMAGLLLAIAAADLLGLGIIARVRGIAERAITVDVALEDRGDDFRVAVLDMRHYHRNIIFAGPSRRGLADFETAYNVLLVQIDRLDELPIDDVSLPSLQLLRAQVQEYYAVFRPAIDLYESDPRAFTRASDDGLLCWPNYPTRRRRLTAWAKSAPRRRCKASSARPAAPSGPCWQCWAG